MLRLDSPSSGPAALLSTLALILMAPARAQEDIRTVPMRGETVMGRARPEVDPLGIRAGGFKFDASAAVGVGYDDNIAGRNNPTIGDGFVDTNARLRIASDWSQHAIGIQAGVTDRRYFSQTSFDWLDWDIRAFGRYDINADTQLSASYAHLRLHLPPTRVDVQAAGLFQPVVYTQDEFSAAGSTRLNRVLLGFVASYVMTRYENINSAGPAGQFSNLDYDTFNLGLNGSYEFAPGRSMTLAVRYQDVSYRDVSSTDRSSQTWAGLVGFRYDFDGVWQARIAVGYAYRTYEGQQFRNISMPTIEADVTWNVTALTTLTLTAGRIIQESITANAASYVSTNAFLRADHELYRNVILTGAVGLNGQEYQGPTARALDLVLRASGQWLVNRGLAISLEYQRVDRILHSGGLPNFDSNVVFLRARVAL